MTLGIFLAMGESFKNMANAGQDGLFKKFYLSYFAKNFDKVYIFSYENEKVKGLPKNVYLIPNKYKIHRYFYSVILPFINYRKILSCDVFRAYHLYGVPPAIIAKIFFRKNFTFNFAYDYQKFAKIENKPLQVLFFKVLEPIAVFFASKIFAANRQILKKLLPKKAIYLPNGVDVDFFKPQKTKRENKQSFSANKQSFSANKKPFVLSVGRLEKQKNFEALISAMKGIGAKLMIVGHGSLKKRLKNLAKRNRVDLKIIDKVPHTQMPKIYNSADIFVLPSLAEGSPKALLEAMACGLPTAVTNLPDIEEIVKDGRVSLLVAADHDNFGASIKHLLQNPQLQKNLGKSARKRIIDHFSLHSLLDLEVTTIKSIVNQ